jgi:hypothetical protein
MFIWNKKSFQEFFGLGTFDEFFVPIIQGFIGELKTDKINIFLFSWRAYSLGGTRYNHRGVNKEGKVANYVETETIIETSSLLLSHV